MANIKAALELALKEIDEHNCEYEYVTSKEKIKQLQDALASEEVKGNETKNELRTVLDALVQKLDKINSHSSYRYIWDLAFAHGHKYDGPQYDKELDAARNLLYDLKEMIPKEAAEKQ